MIPDSHQEFFRKIPKVDDLLNHPGLEETGTHYPHHAVVKAIRGVLEEIREEIVKEKTAPVSDLLFNTEAIVDKVKAMTQPHTVRR